MGIGVSAFLITVGAILRFAITVDLEGVSVHAMGNILMIAGGCWIVISLLLMRRRAVVGQNTEAGSGNHDRSQEPPAV